MRYFVKVVKFGAVESNTLNQDIGFWYNENQYEIDGKWETEDYMNALLRRIAAGCF